MSVGHLTQLTNFDPLRLESSYCRHSADSEEGKEHGKTIENELRQRQTGLAEDCTLMMGVAVTKLL